MPYKDKSMTFDYNNEFNRNNYDRISLIVPKGKKALIQSKAKEKRLSTNALIISAVDKLIDEGEGFGISSASDNDILLSRLFTPLELEKISKVLNKDETPLEYIKKCVLETV